MNKEIRSKRGTKRAMGWERHPARCACCVQFQQAVEATADEPMKKPRCKLGDFVTGCHSVCDKWKGHDGSTLE